MDVNALSLGPAEPVVSLRLCSGDEKQSISIVAGQITILALAGQ
jgi:hypothetical protein